MSKCHFITQGQHTKMFQNVNYFTILSFSSNNFSDIAVYPSLMKFLLTNLENFGPYVVKKKQINFLVLFYPLPLADRALYMYGNVIDLYIGYYIV